MSNCLKILLAVVNIIGCNLPTRVIKLLEDFFCSTFAVSQVFRVPCGPPLAISKTCRFPSVSTGFRVPGNLERKFVTIFTVGAGLF